MRWRSGRSASSSRSRRCGYAWHGGRLCDLVVVSGVLACSRCVHACERRGVAGGNRIPQPQRRYRVRRARASEFVSGGYLTALNDRATLGRLLSRSDDVAGAIPVAVLSHGFWRRRLGADPSIVGREIWLNGSPFTVIGVAADRFHRNHDTPPSLWAPLSAYHLAFGGPPIDQHTSPRIHVVGRLRQGIARAEGEAALSAQRPPWGNARSSAATPSPASGSWRPMSASIARNSGHRGSRHDRDDCRPAHRAARQRERGASVARQRRRPATRAGSPTGGSGATRGRLVRQLLTESVSLGIAGGAIGLLLTIWLVPMLTRLTDAPAAIDLSPDPLVYAFLAAVSIAGRRGRRARAVETDAVPRRHIFPEGAGRPRGRSVAARACARKVDRAAGGRFTGAARAGGIADARHGAGVGRRHRVRASHLLTVSPSFGRDLTNRPPPALLGRSRRARLGRAWRYSAPCPTSRRSAVRTSRFSGEGATTTRFTTTHAGSLLRDAGPARPSGLTYTRDEVADRCQVVVISETLAATSTRTKTRSASDSIASSKGRLASLSASCRTRLPLACTSSDRPRSTSR